MSSLLHMVQVPDWRCNLFCSGLELLQYLTFVRRITDYRHRYLYRVFCVGFIIMDLAMIQYWPSHSHNMEQQPASVQGSKTATNAKDHSWPSNPGTEQGGKQTKSKKKNGDAAGEVSKAETASSGSPHPDSETMEGDQPKEASASANTAPAQQQSETDTDHLPPPAEHGTAPPAAEAPQGGLTPQRTPTAPSTSRPGDDQGPSCSRQQQIALPVQIMPLQPHHQSEAATAANQRPTTLQVNLPHILDELHRMSSPSSAGHANSSCLYRSTSGVQTKLVSIKVTDVAADRATSCALPYAMSEHVPWFV